MISRFDFGTPMDTGAVVMQYDPEEGAWRPAESFTDPEYAYPDSMFFRWRLVVER